MFSYRLRRLLRLPTPVELGWSDVDALGSRDLTPYQEGKTWEDWREYCSLHYPARYFLSEVLSLWVSVWLIWPLGRLRDWVLDHVMPSRRYHFFDLRGIDPLSDYRHGYLDPSTVFWLAGWGSLMRWYRESADSKNPIEWLGDSEHPQVKDHREALALVQYWTVTRVERDAEKNELMHALDEIRKTPENRERYDLAQETWLKHYQESVELEQAMWLRLAAIHNYLWD